jgi:TolB-like protein
MSAIWKPLLAALLLALLAACGGLPEPITRVMAPPQRKAIFRVAVFPFSDSASDPRMALRAERIFFTELVREKLFDVVPEGDVRLFFRRNQFYPGDFPDSREFAALRRQLRVDAIITGRIDEIGPAPGRNAGYVISLQINLIDTRSGRKLVATFLRRRGLDYQEIIHFGVITTASGLLRQMAREVYAQWQAMAFGRPGGPERLTRRPQPEEALPKPPAGAKETALHRQPQTG